MQRYFAKDLKENKLILYDSDIHHIKKVMRMNINDMIEVVYNSTCYLCKITDLNNFNINIEDTLKQDRELNSHIIIAAALVKEQKIDFILQKTTELGVKEIIPTLMERCNVKLDKDRYDKKKTRWESICKEASEQSMRTSIPVMGNICKLKDIVNISADLKLVCSTKEKDKNLKYYLQNKSSCGRILLVIGPEGGISDNEEEYLINNGFNRVSLGKRILRVETACIYACSVISYEME